jgi:transcriptional regulator with PAS, ATPase and Fis domain
MNPGFYQLPHEWLSEIINLAAERIVVVDRDGIIRYINSAYCDFLGTTIESATNKPVQEVIQNSRMHIVAKTGQAEIAAVQPINGSEMIANRHPLFINGELVGALGTVMFGNPQEWWEYSSKIQTLMEELKFYKNKYEKELKSKYNFDDLIGASPSFTAVKQLAEKISWSQSAVLIIGESGTGKELFAHSIHHKSPRAVFTFVPINCASIPEHLLESELFGYEEGAFTGAKRGGKKGKFELANYGTIFLDEVGDMPISMQSKLLRVLQEKEIQRVGGQKTFPIDVRIIAATNRNLEEMVTEGKFRQDLYYRLNVIKLDVPALKDRVDDIPLIAAALIKKLERKFHRDGIGLSEDVVEKLKNYSWPGNIRELENVLERAINVLDDRIIETKHLPLYLREQILDETTNLIHLSKECIDQLTSKNLPTLRETLEFTEKQSIIKALQIAGGSKQQAAKVLAISKTRFYEKCKQYGI